MSHKCPTAAFWGRGPRDVDWIRADVRTLIYARSSAESLDAEERERQEHLKQPVGRQGNSGRLEAGRLVFACAALALLIVLGACTASSIKPPEESTTATVSVSASIEHLDAHDGGIVQAGAVYYEFGTSYGCGFQFGVIGTRFCGISVYSSSDLRVWKALGLAFDPETSDWQQACTPGGCFRPHVVYNEATHRYVMWINVFTGAYRVLTSPSPTGPWSLNRSAGAVPDRSGDENLFVDADGVGYLIRTDLTGKQATAKSHELEILRLDPTYENLSTGKSRPPIGFVEAPTLWERRGTYYLAYSDPACPYCTGTGTSVITARTPLGPWSAPYSISSDSCHGQPTQVSTIRTADGITDLYQSDNWVRLGTDRITRNQKQATQSWAPLAYEDGRVSPVKCP
jgi:beta-xylosidase